MRKKIIIKNITSTLLLQLITVLCGFIIPRLFLRSFGSSVYGMVNSITQFLGYIVLLESGVGGVVKAALYKPLSQKNINKISGIIRATEKFFQKIAYFFLLYLLIIAILYPQLVKNEFEWFYVFSLVIIIGVSTIIQYYYGLAYQILLQADQKIYFTSVLQVFTIIINTIIVFILIKLGFGIHIVKLGSSFILVLRPIILNLYVKKHYHIKKDCEIDYAAIKQRWDGFGHHIAFFIHKNTDIVIITIFLNVKEVAVYSVYLMVVIGIQKIVNSISSSITPTIGNLIVTEKKESLNNFFNLFEFSIFFLTTVFFTCTAILIVSFISIYTKDITDVNYSRPFFAYLLTLAEAIYCIRFPYSSIILSAGYYRQTKRGAYIEAGVNIIISLILVRFYGIVGVAIGTLVAMSFRTFQYVYFLSKTILNRPIILFIKRCFINIIAIILIILLVNILPDFSIISYHLWACYALFIFIISLLITFIVNYIFDASNMKKIFKRYFEKEHVK